MRLLLLLLLLAPLAPAQLLPSILQQHTLDNRTKVLFHQAIEIQIGEYFDAELHARDPQDPLGMKPRPTLEVKLQQAGKHWTLSARVWKTEPAAGSYFIGQAECETKGDVIDFIERTFPSAVPDLKKMLAAAR